MGKQGRDKRILIFSAYFHPHVGGYEKNVYELSRRLAERGFEVDIITCNTQRAPTCEELDGIHVYRIPSWNILGGTYPVPKMNLTTVKILRRLLQRKYDIVNTQTRFMTTSLIGLVFAKIKRTPLIHTERGAKHSVVSSGAVNLISRIYDHTIGTLIVRLASQNIGVSSAACDFVRHLGAKKVALIYNGIDTVVFKKRDTNLRRELCLDESSVVITFVGRLIYAKGVQDLIAAFPKVKKRVPNVKVLIVGDGPYKATLETLVNHNHCSENIVFLGQKNQDEVIDILSATDIFVNSSYSEGLPTSVMEAASIGLPVVATDVGGTREIIDDERTGVLVKEGDVEQLACKLCELATNAKLRNDLSKNARKLVKQKYNWDMITDMWVKELEDKS